MFHLPTAALFISICLIHSLGNCQQATDVDSGLISNHSPIGDVMVEESDTYSMTNLRGTPAETKKREVDEANALLEPGRMETNTESEAKGMAIKLNALSPFINYYVEALFEKSLRSNKSLEVGLGYIGLGGMPSRLTYNGWSRRPTEPQQLANKSSARGLMLRLGMKWIHSRSFDPGRRASPSPLRGSYIRPEFLYGAYSFDTQANDPSSSSPRSTRHKGDFGAIHLLFGKQWIIHDHFSVDIYVGPGIGSIGTDDVQANYASISPSGENGLLLKGGMNIGLLIR